MPDTIPHLLKIDYHSQRQEVNKRPLTIHRTSHSIWALSLLPPRKAHSHYTLVYILFLVLRNMILGRIKL